MAVIATRRSRSCATSTASEWTFGNGARRTSSSTSVPHQLTCAATAKVPARQSGRGRVPHWIQEARQERRRRQRRVGAFAPRGGLPSVSLRSPARRASVGESRPRALQPAARRPAASDGADVVLHRCVVHRGARCVSPALRWGLGPVLDAHELRTSHRRTVADQDGNHHGREERFGLRVRDSLLDNPARRDSRVDIHKPGARAIARRDPHGCWLRLGHECADGVRARAPDAEGEREARFDI